MVKILKYLLKNYYKYSSNRTDRAERILSQQTLNRRFTKITGLLPKSLKRLNHMVDGQRETQGYGRIIVSWAQVCAHIYDIPTTVNHNRKLGTILKRDTANNNADFV